MRLSLITARLGDGAFVVLAPPGNPRERSAEFKALVIAPDRPPDIAELALWESGSGIIKRKKFAAQPVPAELIEELQRQLDESSAAAPPPTTEPAAETSDEVPGMEASRKPRR